MFGYLNNDPNQNLKFGGENDKKTNDFLIDKYDTKLMNYLVEMYNNLGGEKIDLDRLENSLDVLSRLKQKQEYNYLSNLLKPEQAKGSKIPSPIPVPSAAFQLHNSITLSTNGIGNLACVFNPFFLYDSNTGTSQNPFPINYDNTYLGSAAEFSTANFLSSFWVNKSADLTGNMQGQGVWEPVNIGQGIPNVYDQYRLVSASVLVKYIGRLDIVSGVIGGAIIFDESPYIGLGGGAMQKTGGSTQATYSSISPNLSKYSNFDLAMDSFYHQENLCLEGCRELYFPIDNTFEEYMKLANTTTASITPYLNTENVLNNVLLKSDQDYYKSGFNYMIYVLGAPANTACFKVDIYCNFECLPNAEFLNYMPITPSAPSISSKEKNEAIVVVQNKPVMKVNDTENTAIIPKKETIFDKLKRGFGRFLPSIVNWGKIGLSTLVPGLKPALALAGNMIAANKTVSPMLLEETVD